MIQNTLIIRLIVPKRLAERPIADNGYHTPWFVYIDETGKPDFRVVDPDKSREAIIMRRCWICGQRLGKHMAFNVGPVSAIKRISAEPPSHSDCATYAAQVCPFLANPAKGRREKNLPAGVVVNEEMPGHNPGIACVWITTSYQVFGAHQSPTGYLIRMAEPETLTWFKEGRAALADEVLESLAEARAKWIDAASPSETAEIENGYVKLLAMIRSS